MSILPKCPSMKITDKSLDVGIQFWNCKYW